MQTACITLPFEAGPIYAKTDKSCSVIDAHLFVVLLRRLQLALGMSGSEHAEHVQEG